MTNLILKKNGSIDNMEFINGIILSILGESRANTTKNLILRRFKSKMTMTEVLLVHKLYNTILCSMYFLLMEAALFLAQIMDMIMRSNQPI